MTNNYVFGLEDLEQVLQKIVDACGCPSAKELLEQIRADRLAWEEFFKELEEITPKTLREVVENAEKEEDA